MPVTNPSRSDELGHLVIQLARFEALLESLPLAVGVFDERLMLVRANTRFSDLVNLGLGQTAARSIYDAFPNALADFSEQIDTALGGKAAAARRVSFQHRSGQRIVEASIVPIGEEFGIRGVIFLGLDVTEREELREDLARSVAQLESIFEVIPDSVRVYDAEGRITHSNRQAQLDHAPTHPPTLSELWKLDRPRTVDGTSIFMHEHPTARALRGEKVRGQTLAVRRGPAAEVIEVNSNPLRDAHDRIRGAVTVDRDVTERVRLSRQLEEQVRTIASLYERVSTEAERLERMVEERTTALLALQESRERDSRLTAVGQLAAGVMHDVNNALNPIVAAAYLLELHASDPVAVRDYAARIAKAAETGAATAARVGRFIRQEPVQSDREELVDLSALVDDVVEITYPLWSQRALGASIDLARNLTPGVLIRGNPGEIREALINLVQNALDAMTAGGTLGLLTRVRDDYACVEVIDSGIGMTDEVRTRAFEPFFSTKGSRGTGLGLAEVYGIAKRHRGYAEIESAPARGTTVRLGFPCIDPPVDALPAQVPRKALRRVLLVEDNRDGREFMQKLLESDGHQVESVPTMTSALERLNGEGAAARFDLLLTDIGLPDGSGWQLVEQVRERWPSIRIGVITGYEVPTPSASADFTLRKPVRTHELLTLVGRESHG